MDGRVSGERDYRLCGSTLIFNEISEGPTNFGSHKYQKQTEKLNKEIDESKSAFCDYLEAARQHSVFLFSFNHC